MNKIKILLVDDDPQVLDMIGSALSVRDNFEVTMAIDATEALHHIKSREFDTVISDINMPGINGLTLMDKINQIDSTLPVIFITGFADVPTMQAAIKLGVFDFLRKPFSITELQVSVNQAVQKKQLIRQNEKYTRDLEIMVQLKTSELHEANRLLEQNFIRTSLAMINALEANDLYTRGHSERVTNVSILIGHKLKMSIDQLKILRIGAVLHDIGKIGVLSTLQNKSARLSDDELDIVKQHPVIGEQIINPISMDKEICYIILQHHERIDGSGYPNGLKGDDISVYAKIVAIADAYDAMTSGRAYRVNLSHEQAYNEIQACAGSHFDQEYADIFLQIALAYNLSTLDILSSDSLLVLD